MKKVAVLIDAGFLQKIYKKRLKKNIDEERIVLLSKQLIDKSKEELFRIYYYDSPPFNEVVTNPIDGSKSDFSQSNLYRGSNLFSYSFG